MIFEKQKKFFDSFILKIDKNNRTCQIKSYGKNIRSFTDVLKGALEVLR